jgi:L-alanine-DL-glutamate epimerase-like enolase superfamily enzyme
MRLETRVEDLPMKAPFRISGFTFWSSPVAVVTLREGSQAGTGEASGVYYLEDEPAGMPAQIEKHRQAIEAGISREELQRLLPRGGARNALDCAFWDLEAKRAGQPVWKLAGLEPPRKLVTTFTLGAEDPAFMANAARNYPHARALKLKLSGDLDVDVERVKAVRAARPEPWIGVDANQGYDPAKLEKLLPVLLAARVQLLEQPIARGREADLEHFDCDIPIAADESVQGIDDLESLPGRFDIVNIKLDKCGGLTEGLQMARVARRMGLGVMVGNMVGSSLAMAPGFVVGQYCDVVDLDGPTFLATDRSPGVVYEDGMIWCPDSVWGGPGNARQSA